MGSSLEVFTSLWRVCARSAQPRTPPSPPLPSPARGLEPCQAPYLIANDLQQNYGEAVHIPDGFINGATSLGAAAGALTAFSGSIRRLSRSDPLLPLTGLAGAFIFAFQMLNFPVAAGTSGHVVGGALAAILLGPARAVVTLSLVTLLQALVLADGGISALGLNVLNLGVVAPLAGWATFQLAVRALPRRPSSAASAAVVAGLVSVLAAAFGLVGEYALGGNQAAPLRTVLTAMLGAHVAVGLAEGLITSAVVATVLRVRPDLVRGGRQLAPVTQTSPTWGIAAAGVIAVVAVTALLPWSSQDPDVFTSVAADQGLVTTAPTTASPDQTANPTASLSATIVAGVLGTMLLAGFGTGLLTAFRKVRGK